MWNKICGLILVSLLLVTPALATNFRYGAMITHREIIDTNDTFTYGSGDEDKTDLREYRTVLVLVDVGGTSPSWDLTPEFGDSTVGKYFAGNTSTVTEDSSFVLDVNFADEFIIRCDGKSGTSPTIDIYIIPIIETQ
jgi:hypothetical protein